MIDTKLAAMAQRLTAQGNKSSRSKKMHDVELDLLRRATWIAERKARDGRRLQAEAIYRVSSNILAAAARTLTGAVRHMRRAARALSAGSAAYR